MPRTQPGPDVLTNAIQDVLNAWLVPGPHPGYHAYMVGIIREDWPTLASALDALEKEAAL